MASRWPRRVLIGVGVVVVGLAALHANYARLDAGALRANVAPILAEARLGGKAKPEYQELALATLPPNPRTGEYFRLDDMLDRAVVRQAPPAATVDNAVIQALEFDDPAPGFKPAQDGAAVAVRDGALEVVNDPDDTRQRRAARRAARRGRRHPDPRPRRQGQLPPARLVHRRRPEGRQDLARQVRHPLPRQQGLPHLRGQRAQRAQARAQGGREPGAALPPAGRRRRRQGRDRLRPLRLQGGALRRGAARRRLRDPGRRDAPVLFMRPGRS